MSDAAVDVFAEAFEEDPIRLAVAAAMAKLAEKVRGLPQYQFWPDEEPETVLRADVLRLIEKATP